jgi:hypothetical protein
MEYFLQCPCGIQTAVTDGAAGTSLSCTCGRALAVPRLGVLRRSVGVVVLEETANSVNSAARDQALTIQQATKRNPSDLLSLHRFPAIQHEICCSWCGRHSPKVRSYSLLHLVFPWVFIYVRTESVLNCPSCMRSCLLQRTLLGILTANLLAPIVIVWNSFQFLRTFFA